MKGAPKKESRNLPIFNKNRMREVKVVKETVGRKTESSDRFGSVNLNMPINKETPKGKSALT